MPDLVAGTQQGAADQVERALVAGADEHLRRVTDDPPRDAQIAGDGLAQRRVPAWIGIGQPGRTELPQAARREAGPEGAGEGVQRRQAELERTNLWAVGDQAGVHLLGH
ncbi:hypothetical protein D9M71_530440 [compost metagenome]